jgi:integrase
MATTPLTDAAIAAAPAGSMLADGNRLRLRLTTRGAGSWQLKLRTGAGKDTTKTLGAYPAMSINKARSAAEDARAAAATVSADAPAAPTAAPTAAITFGTVGKQYIDFARGRDNRPPSAGTLRRRWWLFDKLSKFHNRPLVEIMPTELRQALEAIQGEGTGDVAHRTLILAVNIFDHAQRHEIYFNPAARHKGWLIAHQGEHHPAITDPKAFGTLAELIDTFSTTSVGRATQLIMRTAVRPGELRAAQWSEFHDLDKPDLAEWRIPSERMKMKRAHSVPLSRQAVAVLKLQQTNSPVRPGAFVFPSGRIPGECIHHSSMKNYLDALGFGGQHVAHGFRASFRTLMLEVGRERIGVDGLADLLERCLAHKESDATREAYDRAELRQARRKVMQFWADYIDELKAADVAEKA